MKNLEAALSAWLKNTVAVGASPCTVKNYTGAGQRYLKFVSEQGISDAGAFQAVQAYRDHLLADGLAPSSVKQHLAILRAFFEYASSPALGEGRFCTQNPVDKSLIPKTSRANKRPYDQLLTDAQICRLWRNERPRGISPGRWARNYAVVILLLTAELRNSELRELRESDLHIGGPDGEGSFLVVEHGKGDKYRVVDLPEIAVTAVLGYLNSGYRPDGLPDTAPLFGNRFMGAFRKFSRQGLSELVEVHVRLITGVESIRTHDLRHIGARIDLNSGMSWAELQAKLGHSSPNITQIYSGRLMARAGRRGAAEVIRQRDEAAAEQAEKMRLNLSGRTGAVKI